MPDRRTAKAPRIVASVVGGVAAVAAVLTPAPASAAGAPIACGTVLTASITLKADLTCTGDALIVGADGITVDLGHHAVRGSTSGVGIGVDNRQNVTVQNGRVVGFARGAQVSQGRSVSFTRMDLHAAGPLLMLAPDGVTIRDSSLGSVTGDVDHLTVTRSVITGGDFTFGDGVYPTITHDTFTDASIGMGEMSLGVIADNTLVRSRIGIAIADKMLVQHNRISGAPVGLSIGAVSDHVQVLDNLFENDGVGTSVQVQNVDELAGMVVTGNTYRHNGAAGMLFTATSAGCTVCPKISANLFVDNGFNPGGLTDDLGNPVADGLHIAVPAATPILVAGNTTRHNASYGIFAPTGSVQDGGGNTSSHDPNGCLGVTCTR